MGGLTTDYLVVGAGAAGMAFADSLVTESDDDVVIIDRRHRPGGHWNDAYPLVRLHQPSAFYGVSSRTLGSDSIDASGPNAGFYEQATGLEICGYYQRVLEDHLLASGRVRFLGMCDYLGGGSAEHRLASRLTGEETTVRVRRKVSTPPSSRRRSPRAHAVVRCRPRRAADLDQRIGSVDGARHRLHGDRCREDGDRRMPGSSPTACPPT